MTRLQKFFLAALLSVSTENFASETFGQYGYNESESYYSYQERRYQEALDATENVEFYFNQLKLFPDHNAGAYRSLFKNINEMMDESIESFIVAVTCIQQKYEDFNLGAYIEKLKNRENLTDTLESLEKIDKQLQSFGVDQETELLNTTFDTMRQAFSTYAHAVKALPHVPELGNRSFNLLKDRLKFVETLQDKDKMTSWIIRTFKDSCPNGLLENMTMSLKGLDPALDRAVFFDVLAKKSMAAFEQSFLQADYTLMEPVTVHALFLSHNIAIQENMQTKTQKEQQTWIMNTWVDLQIDRLHNVITLPKDPSGLSDNMVRQITEFREDIARDVPLNKKTQLWKQKQMKQINDFAKPVVMDWADIADYFRSQI